MIMNEDLKKKVAEAKKAALEVLIHNFKLNEPFYMHPKTSAWEGGYHEPYTRDLMIASLGILITDKKDYKDNNEYEQMINSLRTVLETLAKIQTKLGHIPGWVHDDTVRGASDTTPLFILAVVFFRKVTGEKIFLNEAVQKAMTWMEYQSPDDSGLVSQLHTTDWRDEHWGFQGFCLFVNTIVYSYLRHLDQLKRAEEIRERMNQHVPSGLLATHENFYAMCVFKTCSICPTNPRFNICFDLLGNSLAILSGIASPEMAKKIISYVEKECKEMQASKELTSDLPPNFFPFVTKNDLEWCPRYQIHGQPGNYQNGGIWPFICGFYVAALVAAGETELAEHKLDALTDLVKLKREPSPPAEQKNSIHEPLEKDISFGFNEWFKAQNEWFEGQNKTQNESLKPQDEWFKARNDRGEPIMGHNWQTWSAGMYLYAAKCVETNSTPFFDKIRG